MTRLINSDAFLEALEKVRHTIEGEPAKRGQWFFYKSIDTFIELIKAQPEVTTVPVAGEHWTLAQIMDLIDYSTTSTMFDVFTAHDEVCQLRNLFNAHNPDGTPREIAYSRTTTTKEGENARD